MKSKRKKEEKKEEGKGPWVSWAVAHWEGEREGGRKERLGEEGRRTKKRRRKRGREGRGEKG